MKKFVKITQKFALKIYLPLLTTIFLLIINTAITPNTKEGNKKKWDLFDFTKEAGLSTTNIFQIDFNKDNTAWLATSIGLIKYDGFKWKTYTTKDGLPSNFVRTVRVIGQDSLWVGTDSGAVFFDGKMFSTKGSDKGLASKNVRLIYRDNSGIIWFCSDSWPLKNKTGGLSFLKNGEWYTEPQFSNKYVVNIFQDSERRYFVVTDEGVYVRRDNKWRKENIESKDETINWTSSSIIQVKDLGVVISTGSSIFVFKNNKWKRLNNVPNHLYGITNYGERSFAIYNQSTPDYRVFSVFDRGNFKVATSEHKTIRGYIENLVTDPNGNIWAVGYGLVMKWSLKNYEWIYYSDKESEILFPFNNKIILLEKNEIISKDESGKREELFRLKTNISFSQTSKAIWDNEKIYLIDKKDFKKIIIPSTIQITLIKNVVKTKNALWVLLNRHGQNELYQVSVSKWRKVSLPNNFHINNINSNKDGVDIWLELKDKTNHQRYIGLYQRENFSIIATIPKVINNGLMGTLFIDSKNGMWIYSESGAYNYDTKIKEWIQVKELIGRAITSIAELNNALWLVNNSTVGGEDGLSKISLTDLKITNFETDIIICSNKDENGYLLFGSLDKFYVIGKETFFEPYEIGLPTEAKISFINRYRSGKYLIVYENGILELQPSYEDTKVDLSMIPKETITHSIIVLKLIGKRKYISEDLKNNFKYSIKINNGEWSKYRDKPEIILNTDTLNLGINEISARCQDIGLDSAITESSVIINVSDIPLQKKPYFIPIILIGLGIMTMLTLIAFRSEKKLKSLVGKKTSELQKTTIEYQNLFESANDAIIIFEPEKEIILKVNDTACKMYGYTKEELIGKSLKELTQNIEAEEKQTQLTIQTKTFNNFETKQITKDGRIIDLLINATVIEYGNKTAILSINREITELKKAEIAIKESESKYKKLFENNPLPMWIYDLDTLKFVDVNNTACSKYGYTREEFLTLTLFDIRPEDEIAKLKENLSEKDHTIKISGNWKHRKKNGEIIKVEIISHKMPTVENRKTRLVVANDVTEKLKVAEKLKESEKRYRNIFETANEGICVTNKIEEIISVNKKFTDMVGYTNSELIGKKFEMFIIEEELTEYNERQERRRFGKNDNYEQRLLRKDGSTIWTSVAAAPIVDENEFYNGSFGMFSDINEKKLAEQEIRKLSRGVEQSPATIIITDRLGNIEYVNSKFCETTGYTFAEVIGKNPRILKSGEQSQEEYKKLWETIMAGNEWYGELQNKKKNGELYWEYASISSIKNDIGEVINFIAIKEDITERKKMINELIEAKELAVQSDKLKSEFLNQMSHEIRTPINIILGNTDYLNDLMGKNMDPDARDCFDGIDLASTRIIRTVDLILNAAEFKTSGYQTQLVKIDLDSEILSKLYKEHELSAKQKGLEIKYICNEKETNVTADNYSITQIFANLIDNAIKYTKKGKVEILLEKNKTGKIIVEIKDTGIGMNKEFLSKMFEPFTQEEQGSTRSYDGNGLGLALVKNYCDINNATIEVESEKNVGTTFRVIFKD